MLFIPKKINVGYNSRNDTYSGKLAYIIYYDDKGVLRKETSWSNWRDKKLGNEEFDNVPTEGFVLNKTAGGNNYSWNPRQTYTRVYDPRGFEFEISIPNLLYILENTNSIKGKGLEGEFTYGWDGTELTLIPCNSPDYKECKDYSDSLYIAEYIKPKDLIEGKVYKFKNGNVATYMGKYNKFCNYDKSVSKKKFVFHYYQGSSFFDYSSIGGKIISVENEGFVDEKYHNYVRLLRREGYINAYGSPTMVKLNFKVFKNYIDSHKIPEWRHDKYCEVRYNDKFGEMNTFYINDVKMCRMSRPWYYTNDRESFNLTSQDVYDKVQPHVFKYYTDKTKTITIEVGYGI